MATATATNQDPTGVLVPLLAAAANLVANDPDRPVGAEAVAQTRDTFTEFIGIIGEGEQMLVIQQDRSRRAAEWEDTEDCDLYSGICLGTYRERSDGGGTVTRVAVWVRAFDTERTCDTAEDARELWREYRTEPDAFDEDGILYGSGIKSARAPFSGELELDSPGRVIKAAKELQGHPVKMYRQLREFKLPNGKVRQVGVVHRVELNADADDGAAEEVEEAPAPKRGGGSKSTRSTGSRSSASKSGTKTGQRSTGSRSSSKSGTASKSGSTRKTSSRASKPADPDPEPQDDSDAGDDVPESKEALVKWATGQGIGRGTLSRFLAKCEYPACLPGVTEDDVADAYELIVDGINNGELGV